MTVRDAPSHGPPYRQPRVAVIGERKATEDLLLLAEQVGREIARCNAVLICGGMGGVMEAASRGCNEAGGLVVGILPTDSVADANCFVNVPIVTGMGEGRNIIVVRSAQVVIAIGGSYGTLSEIAFASGLEIPVVGLQTWALSDRQGRPDGILRVQTAEAAVERAMSLIEN